jgi:prophage regulatory protein
MPPISFLRLPGVLALTGLKKTTLYMLIKDGKFPPSLVLTARTRAWRSDEVQAWIDERIEKSMHVQIRSSVQR